jgi:phosphoserine aminotransferase
MFSRPLEIGKYGLIYAGAQKNLGPSGVVLVIIRNDLVELGSKDLPTMLQYRTYAKENSMYNTPNTFGIYVMGEVFKWIKAEGGLKAMAEHNEAKAKVLYDYLDQSRMFKARALPGSRSLMNVCFFTASDELDSKFVTEATKAGFEGLRAIGRPGPSRQHLQCDAGGGGEGAGRVHEDIRARQRLSWVVVSAPVPLGNWCARDRRG